MLDGDFCGHIAAADDRESRAARVADGRAQRDDIHILRIFPMLAQNNWGRECDM